MLSRRLLPLLFASFIFSGELEVDGNLKVSGNVVFQDESSISTAPITLPSGLIMPFAGQSAPEGWLLCYGQEVSRDTYSDLFDAVTSKTKKLRLRTHKKIFLKCLFVKNDE